MTGEDKDLLDFFLSAEPEEITLNPKQYDRLRKMLESEPELNEKLRGLLSRYAPWEQPIPPLSERDRDRFLAALDRPARPVPEAIGKARARHDTRVVSDEEKS